MRMTRALALTAVLCAGLVSPVAAAATPAETFDLFVLLAGDGSGTVTSSPAGIDCGPETFECIAAYESGTEVTLTAAPGPLSTFVGWDGACTGSGDCVVTMSEDLDVVAEFDALVLAVSLDGDGSGGVTSSPGGITCDEESFDCWEAYESGTEVTLTATVGPASVFTGWDGACTGTGPCVVTVTEDVEVVAAFDNAWLEVDLAGDGAGTVTSDPPGIECGEDFSDCDEAYLPGTEVELTATPGGAAVFVGWTGACTGTGTCVVTLDDDAAVSAMFDSALLIVSREGDGAGSVTSSPDGITCPSDCFEPYLPGTGVTLTAVPASNAVFTGWGGACSGTGDCVLVLDDDVAVSATFDTGRVWVRTEGDGAGRVTSTPAGIDCPGDCRESFLPGTQVSLVANGGDESIFVGWSGDCSGTGECVVDAGADPSVTATFDTGRLVVDRDGDGAGVVTSEPAGIDCGSDCFEAFVPGTVVTLTPTTQAGSTFAGWSGDCSGLGECVVTLDADRQVTATFNPPGVGGKIAYECSGDICVMNEDGTDQRNLTNTPADQEYAPTLTSDGTRVAFMSNAALEDNPDRNIEIAAMNVDGTGLVQVTHSEGPPWDSWHNYDPDWSPDGTKIAFVSTRESSPTWRQIFVINADGTGETLITDPSDMVERLNPQWSPDGTKIAYTWWLGQQDVYVMNADGSDQTNLTQDEGWWDDRSPAWSPDGTRIAFTSDRFYDPMTFNTDIMVVDSDGSDVVRVTDHLAIDESPTWSPDGLWIAFSSSRGGSYDIWAVEAPPPGGHANGVVEEGLRQLTKTPGPDLEPYWAGDDQSEITHLLRVKKTGRGQGLVESSPDGIRCGSDCREAFVAGSRVWLTATPAAGSQLVGWSVGCTASRACQVIVDDVKTVKVRFEPIIRPSVPQPAGSPPISGPQR